MKDRQWLLQRLEDGRGLSMADGEIIGHKTRYYFWNEKGQSASDAVPQILVHAMHKDGLLTTDTEANEWRITHKGRQFLRRKQ